MNTGHVTETVQTVIVEQVIQTFNIEEIVRALTKLCWTIQSCKDGYRN